MAKTYHQIHNELTMYQCCIADLAIEYIAKEINGIQEIDCLYWDIVYGVMRIETLKKYVTLISSLQYTQQEIEDELEKLNDLCGCVSCNLASFLDDTISTSLTPINY